jgi:hypothetical protein
VKPCGPQSIRWPVLDENSKERFLKEQPRPLNFLSELLYARKKRHFSNSNLKSPDKNERFKFALEMKHIF